MAGGEILGVFSSPEQNHVHFPEVCHGFSITLFDGVSSCQVIKPLPHQSLRVVEHMVVFIGRYEAHL